MAFADFMNTNMVLSLVNAGLDVFVSDQIGRTGSADIFGFTMSFPVFNAGLTGLATFFGQNIKDILGDLIPTTARTMAIEAAILGPLGQATSMVVFYGVVEPIVPDNFLDVVGGDPIREGVVSLAVGSIGQQVTKVGMPLLTGREATGL